MADPEDELLKWAKTLPVNLGTCVQRSIRAGDQRSGLLALHSRQDEFNSHEELLFAGIALNPVARKFFDRQLDAVLLKKVASTSPPDEVVVGGGLHAAIYGANRKAVLTLVEDKRRMGGQFARAFRPVFYLNSRTRQSLDNTEPGREGTLNWIPGGIVQPGHVTGLEYPTNADMAFVIRCNLAYFYRDRRISKATRITPALAPTLAGQKLLRVFGMVSPALYGKRVIIATGLGPANVPEIRTSGLVDRIFSFDEFLRVKGNSLRQFPLQNWENVAVVGASDSGCVVLEYLLGQGPDVGMSVTTLDFPKRIEWFGQQCTFRETFEECYRSRYRGIARYMPRRGNRNAYHRVISNPGRAIAVENGADGARIIYKDLNGEIRRSRLFDHVVWCTGYSPSDDLRVMPKRARDELGTAVDYVQNAPLEPVVVDGEVIAMKYKGLEVYRVGPAAQIPVTEDERRQNPVLQQIPENSAALFRYANRTAKLAKLFNEKDA